MSLFSKVLRTLGLARTALESPGAVVSPPLTRFDRFAADNRQAFEQIGALPEEQIVAEERRLAAEVTEILRSLKPLIGEGVSRLEIQEHVLQQLDSRDLLPALVGYKGYPAAVPVSVNAELISVPLRKNCCRPVRWSRSRSWLHRARGMVRSPGPLPRLMPVLSNCACWPVPSRRWSRG